MIKICESCKKEFNTKVWNRKKCDECLKSKCIICGKEYKATKSNRQTCSEECKKILISRNTTTVYLEERICTFCGTSFTCKNTSKVSTCSRKCSINLRIKNGEYQSPFSRKDVQQKAKRTMLEKYGVDHNFKRKEIIENNKNNMQKNKEEIKRKAIKTMIEKYGEDYKKVISSKIKQTNLKRYGVENVYQSEIVKEKIKENNRQKYNTDWFTQSNEFKDKSKETMNELYNVDYPAQNKEIYNKLKKTNLEKYGVEYACLTDNCLNSTNNVISKRNIDFANALKENNIKYEFEKRIIKYSYDIFLPDNNILIEIDPTYTHNSTESPIFGNKHGKIKDKNYHYNKTKLAKDNGYHCIHIFDWDDKDKIIYLLKPKNKMSAHKCKVIEISNKEANDFLNKYHLQGTCNGQTIRLALVNKQTNEILSIATFGKSRYNKNYQYEFLRYASSDYVIQGGITKLWNYFIEKYDPNSVISYCDNAKFNGNFFKYLGFELYSTGRPTPHYYNVKKDKHFTNVMVLQLGADKLLGTNYGRPEECNMNNRDIMIKEGFVEVYDCGQSTYVWNK